MEKKPKNKSVWNEEEKRGYDTHSIHWNEIVPPKEQEPGQRIVREEDEPE